MEILEPGHVYSLDQLDLDDSSSPPQPEADSNVPLLVFVNRESNPHPGTQTQEVLRALIDRTMHCDNCLRWEGNDLIIFHLRMALALHEARALLRKTEKGIIQPESVPTDEDGHFLLSDQFIGDSRDKMLYEQKSKPDSPLV